MANPNLPASWVAQGATVTHLKLFSVALGPHYHL